MKKHIFDDIRVPSNEVKAPHKIKVVIDKNEYKYDYEKEKMNVPNSIAIKHFKKCIV